MKKTLWIEVSLVGLCDSGSQALDYRKKIEKQIENLNVGEFVGGGCSMDGSDCDLEFECDDLETAKAKVAGVIQSMGLADRTKIKITG